MAAIFALNGNTVPTYVCAFPESGMSILRCTLSVPYIGHTSHVHALAASFARFAMLRQVNLWRSLLEVDEEERVRA